MERCRIDILKNGEKRELPLLQYVVCCHPNNYTNPGFPHSTNAHHLMSPWFCTGEPSPRSQRIVLKVNPSFGYDVLRWRRFLVFDNACTLNIKYIVINALSSFSFRSGHRHQVLEYLLYPLWRTHPAFSVQK